jgi:hypothetical protein
MITKVMFTGGGSPTGPLTGFTGAVLRPARPVMPARHGGGASAGGQAEGENGRGAAETEWRALMGMLRLVGTLGFTIVAAVAGGFLAGLWLSRRLELGAWPVVAGIVGGVVVSSLWAYRALTRAVLGAPRHGRGAEERRN